MHPIIWHITGALSIKAYGIAILVAFVAGIWLSMRRARAVGLKSNDFFDLGFWVLISSIVGARLFYILFHLHEYLAEPKAIYQFWHGGLIFYGGLAGGVAATVIFFKAKRIPLWLGTDVVAPQVALGYAITRLGCFLNGCCFGSPTRLPWGVTFPDNCGAGHYAFGLSFTGLYELPIRLHPTQLYATAASLAIFVVLLLVWRRRRFDGQVFWTYLLLYPLYRFAVEFIRADNKPLLWGLTTPQLMSVALFVCALAAYFNLRARGGLTPARVAAKGKRR